jgi:hypothetical protein
MLTDESIETLIGDIDISDLEFILNNSFEWLLSTFDDNSILINNRNYNIKYSPLKSYFTKKYLKFQWGFKPCKLDWFYYGQWAQYDNDSNLITLHCVKNKTLRFTLECLFLVFSHSLHSLRIYFYFNGLYVNLPLEHDANNFCYEYVPIYWEHMKNNGKLLGH